jgi:hypothetical protein
MDIAEVHNIRSAFSVGPSQTERPVDNGPDYIDGMSLSRHEYYDTKRRERLAAKRRHTAKHSNNVVDTADVDIDISNIHVAGLHMPKQLDIKNEPVHPLLTHTLSPVTHETVTGGMQSIVFGFCSNIIFNCIGFRTDESLFFPFSFSFTLRYFCLGYRKLPRRL